LGGGVAKNWEGCESWMGSGDEQPRDDKDGE